MKQHCENCKKTNNKHEYQDKKNGEWVREYNVWVRSGNEFKRCTVCGFTFGEKSK